MDNFDAAQQYKTTAIKTANSGHIIIMLYEKAIQNLEDAITTIKERGFRGYEEANEKITKTQNIITELAAALDKKVAPKFCENLLSLYLYFNRELGEANFKKETSKLETVKNMLEELLASWKQVANVQQDTSSHKDGPRERINVSS